MMVRNELAHAGAAPPAVEGSDPPGLWQDRSSDELRAIVGRGMHGGDLYFAAAAELERRARDCEAADCAEHAKTAAKRRETVLLVAVLFVAVQAAAILWLVG